ncbi:MAG: F0F1 ATP synthase subunit B [Oscillospiraceae bacterium]|nr:F0F1 ATP synthase subunit B [Oscillospiraceae bacterium]
MEQYQALVTIVPWNFVAQIANLLITMLLVKKFLFDRIQKVLDQRQAMCNAQLQEAEAAREAAQTAQAEYEQALAQARAEAGEILQAANRTAAARSEEMLAEARRQAQAMLAKADADIAQQRKKAVNEVKDELGGIAVDIAAKVVGREVSAEDHAALIDEFIQNVGDAS